MSPITLFGCSDNNAASDIDVWGGKGSNLLTMSSLGLPVPPGFIIDTNVGAELSGGESAEEQPKELLGEVRDGVRSALDELGNHLNLKFGHPKNPLVVSVRSGAAFSMPGMMDTVLNLGLTSTSVSGFGDRHNERFALDTYRRFLQNYSDVVLGADDLSFESILDEFRTRHDCASDSDLPVSALREIVTQFERLTESYSLPPDPFEQLELAILAVFGSWNTPRARHYRDLHDVPHTGGTAVIIQSMVFGNLGDDSCTGVFFTRDPSTGEHCPFGEYLPNAQGEDIVLGVTTPLRMTGSEGMESSFPDAYESLLDYGDRLEKHFLDMQEIEFTVQSGDLWILQTRSGKRTPRATAKIAVEMVNEGLLTPQQAIGLCDDRLLDSILVPRAEPYSDSVIFVRGLPSSPGAVTGEIVFRSEDAVSSRVPVILVRPETDPRDVHGISSSVGVLTSRGGMTSHAAVVARGMNKPCVTAASGLRIDLESESCSSETLTLTRGDLVTIDGSSGLVYVGRIPVVTPNPDGDLAILLDWKRGIGV